MSANSQPSPRRSLRFPNSKRYVAGARRAILDFARSCNVSPEGCDELVSAAGEALANAVEHGHRSGTFFEVRCWTHDGNVVIEIEDDGDGYDVVRRRDEGEPSLRGYGMTIMRACSDSLAFSRRGRLVRITKAIAAQDSSEGQKTA
jgi:anti-sigma regulatory factor (Ser/Thr protein kinase)